MKPPVELSSHNKTGGFIIEGDTMSELEKYLQEEEDLENEILRQLRFGGTPEYEEALKSLIPLGKVPSPVRIPIWMFRKYPNHKQLELSDIEKVALAHVIHFTKADNPTGYIECSGDIENYCKCSVKDAHEALKHLVKLGFITEHTLEPRYCFGHKRNLGYYANIPYLHSLLVLYKMEVWS